MGRAQARAGEITKEELRRLMWMTNVVVTPAWFEVYWGALRTRDGMADRLVFVDLTRALELWRTSNAPFALLK